MPVGCYDPGPVGRSRLVRLDCPPPGQRRWGREARWLDSGHPVPGYVTDALAALCERGLVTLADPVPGGLVRAALAEVKACSYSTQ